MSIKEKMTAIADNIREKTKTTSTLTLDDMAMGVNEVYESGKKAQYDEFWSAFNERAVNFEYMYAGVGWNDITFKPTKDIRVASRTFSRHNWFNRSPYDLATHLEKLGVKIIGMPDPRNSFVYAHFNRLPELDASTTTWPFYDTFYDMRYLVTIDKLIFNSEGTATFQGTPFYNCIALKNIVIEGVIAQTISFSYSPLTAESIKSIVTHLKDYSGTANEYKYTITFKSSAFEALEEEGATSPNKNTWAEYIDDLKWNFVKKE